MCTNTIRILVGGSSGNFFECGYSVLRKYLNYRGLRKYLNCNPGF